MVYRNFEGIPSRDGLGLGFFLFLFFTIDFGDTDLGDFPLNTMAIGRLDEHSEGLLLLTTDGKVSEYIRSSKVEKEYYAQVDGVISDKAIEQLKQGVEIGFDGKVIH